MIYLALFLILVGTLGAALAPRLRYGTQTTPPQILVASCLALLGLVGLVFGFSELLTRKYPEALFLADYHVGGWVGFVLFVGILVISDVAHRPSEPLLEPRDEPQPQEG